MSNKDLMKSITIAKISIIIILVGATSLYFYSKTRVGNFVSGTSLIVCGLATLSSAILPFLLRINRSIIEYILSDAASIIGFPWLYYFSLSAGDKFNINPFLTFGSFIIIIVSSFPFLIASINKKMQLNIDNGVKSFADGEKHLTFKLLHGVNGIDVLNPNLPILLELQETEIRLAEVKFGKYSSMLIAFL